MEMLWSADGTCLVYATIESIHIPAEAATIAKEEHKLFFFEIRKSMS
jgi:hypothetical protein